MITTPSGFDKFKTDPTIQELRQLQLPPNAAIERKLAVYTQKLLPRHPPIFGDWFLKTFADPTSWYGARLVYCRSAAVMSMVGYILGLGDRHGGWRLVAVCIFDFSAVVLHLVQVHTETQIPARWVASRGCSYI